MTIEPIGGETAAVYITPAELKQWGLTPETVTAESAAQLAREALSQAGMQADGTIEIEAYHDPLGLLLFANKLMGNAMHTGALLMMLILPPPYVLPIFADVEEERTDISSALSLLTLIGILLYVVLVIFFA